jgi:hypothetical protein
LLLCFIFSRRSAGAGNKTPDATLYSLRARSL